MKISIKKDGKEQGPFSNEELMELVQQGKYSGDDLACHDGTNWIKLRELPDFDNPNQEHENDSPSKPDTGMPKETEDEPQESGLKGLFQKSKEKTLAAFEKAKDSEKIRSLKDKAKEKIEQAKSGELSQNLKEKAKETADKIKSGEIVHDIKGKAQDISKKLTNSVIFVEIDGNKKGPLNPVQINEMISAGELKIVDMGWMEGMEKWLPLKDEVFADMGIVELDDVTPELSQAPEMPEPPELKDSKEDSSSKKDKFLIIMSILFGIGVIIATCLDWYTIKASTRASGMYSGSSSHKTVLTGLNTSQGQLALLGGLAFSVMSLIPKARKYAVIPIALSLVFTIIGLVNVPESNYSAGGSVSSGGHSQSYSANLKIEFGPGLYIACVFSVLGTLLSFKPILKYIRLLLYYLFYPSIFIVRKIILPLYNLYSKYANPLFNRVSTFNPIILSITTITFATLIFFCICLLTTGSIHIIPTFLFCLTCIVAHSFCSILYAIVIKNHSDLTFKQAVSKAMLIEVFSLGLLFLVLCHPQIDDFFDPGGYQGHVDRTLPELVSIANSHESYIQKFAKYGIGNRSRQYSPDFSKKELLDVISDYDLDLKVLLSNSHFSQETRQAIISESSDDYDGLESLRIVVLDALVEKGNGRLIDYIPFKVLYILVTILFAMNIPIAFRKYSDAVNKKVLGFIILFNIFAIWAAGTMFQLSLYR